MKAVIGLGFGDEGKGATTDWLCSFSDPSCTVVTRFSGGQQAGHNVIVDDTQHVFSNFGSGSIRGAKTYWESTCTIDPIGIWNEYHTLLEKGIKPVLFINGECPITTPMDKRANQNCSDTKSHGTCGVGFFETLKREKANFSLTAFDIKYPTALNIKYQSILNDYYDIGHMNHKHQDFEFMQTCEWMMECVNIHIVDDLYDVLGVRHTHIYEGSQGLLLDQDIGFFPHCTPSNTGSKFFTDMELMPDYYLVTRAYQTRHGNGPMTNHGDFQPLTNPNEQNFDTGAQGKFRKSMLDLDLLEYAIGKDDGLHAYNSILVITCLEHMPRFVFYHAGREWEYDTKEEFGRNVTEKLGLRKFVLCTNHVFGEICNII